MIVTVVGAGSWGSTIARMLGDKGMEVKLWARNAELVQSINSEHRNYRFLPELEFAPSVHAGSDLAQCLAGAEAVVMATPSSALLEIATQAAPHLDPAVPVVMLTKGVSSSGEMLLDVLQSGLGGSGRSAVQPGFDGPGRLDAQSSFDGSERLAVLSGPNLAKEVAKGMPSATVIASANEATANFFQELFATSVFRVYTSQDVIGVQLSGASKNIFAIACGMAAGLNYGDNTIAMLMTRGLAEISRLVTKMGGDPLTCMGLAGVGDLIATCYSPHSRNRTFGTELAKGVSLDEYQARTHMVVEGALACKTVTDLAAKHDVDMPISRVVRAILWDDMSVNEALALLLDRTYKPEFY